jgi:hypothetical protein
MPRGTFDTFITFRGEPGVWVHYQIDSGPGSGCRVDWWFDGMSAPEYDALNVTPDEEQAIIAHCIKSYDEDWYGGE